MQTVLIYYFIYYLKIYRRDSQEEIYAGSHQYPGEVKA